MLFAALLLYSCDPEKSASSPTYTTTVSGKIITPGRAADPATGSIIGTAEVWAEPGNKVKAEADGSYRLKVTHSGTFKLKAGYTGTDGNYQTSDPKAINTSAQNIDNQNIALNYGYTTTLSGRVTDYGVSPPEHKNGATITVRVESHVVGSTVSSGRGNYSITFAHPGTFSVTATFPGAKRDFSSPARLTDRNHTSNFILNF